MRRQLNENPVVQAAFVGVLALVVGFLLLTRVLGGEEAAPPEEAAAPPDATSAAPATATPAAPGASAVPPADAAAPATPAPGAPAADVSSKFVSGPGLPGELVNAYEQGKVVTLLIVREKGLDDRKLRAIVEQLRSRGDTAVFVTVAAGIAKYSRITQGVEVERVPALVVLKPRRLSEGGSPLASVSYGFRGPQSVDQAVRDALYSGPADRPYYPE